MAAAKVAVSMIGKIETNTDRNMKLECPIKTVKHRLAKRCTAIIVYTEIVICHMDDLE